MNRIKGFSLVELMVAMVVGLIIILGAGQLFLTVFQTGRQVDELGEKQEVMNFASSILLNDIRRAYWYAIEWDESGDVPYLGLTAPNRGDVSYSSCNYGDPVSKVYRLNESESKGWALEVAQECSASPLDPEDPGTVFSEIVTGFYEDSIGFHVDDAQGDKGVFVVTFRLVSSAAAGFDEFSFFAVNRTTAVREVTE